MPEQADRTIKTVIVISQIKINFGELAKQSLIKVIVR